MEIDPLILELRADLGKYRAELRSSTALVESNLKRQERSVQNLERQMQRSSGAIASSLKGVALSFAGAFSAQQLVGVIDNFTRLQNSLKVAGLEGQSLADVQGKLLGLSGKYGVSINELANLYGKSTQAASDLGATQDQLLQITEASAQALKITGTSAAQAQGALLGLTQALASGTVRAEEFNQINEGGLRPLLQVAAANEKYGGSVAKLRQAVVDGKLSSQEFYKAILGGAEQLEGQASKAVLTLAGAFEALSSRFTVYIGEASAANGATAALAGAINSFANNLETIIPALAVIATAIGVNYVRSAVSASIATGALGAAIASYTAFTGGAATATNVLAFSMNALGKTLPFLAITALVAGLGYLFTRTDDAAQANANLAKQVALAEGEIDSAASSTAKLGVVSGILAAATRIAGNEFDVARAKAFALGAQLGVVAAQALIAARALSTANLAKAQANLVEIYQTDNRSPYAKARGVERGTTAVDKGEREKGLAQVKEAARQDELLRLKIERESSAGAQRLKELGIQNPYAPGYVKPSNAAAADDKKKGKGKGGGSGASGPSAGELTAQYESQLRAAKQQELQAQIALTKDIYERAGLEEELLASQKDGALADIDGDKNLTAERKAALKGIVDSLYGQASAVDEITGIVTDGKQGLLAQARLQGIAEQEAQESSDIAQAQNDVQLEELRGLYDLAETQGERRKLALQTIDAQYDYLESVQQAVIASEKATEAQKEIARLELMRLNAMRAGETSGATEQTAGPLERYIKEGSKTPAELNEQFQGIAVDGLNALNDGLTDAILNSENLGDVFKNVAKSIIADLIRIAIQQLIVNSLVGALSGIFGGVDAVKAATPTQGFVGPAFANGTNFAPGGVALVGERGPELVNLPRGSQVIPNNMMRASALGGGGNGGGGMSVIRLELSGDIDARIQSQSANIAIDVVRNAAPQIRDAAVTETFRRGARPGFRK